MIVTRAGTSIYPAVPLPPGSPPSPEMEAFFNDCETGNAKGVEGYLKRWPKHAEIQLENNLVTGMMLAARKGRNKVIQLLIDASCAVNTRDADGNTALFCALYEGHLSTTKLLLDNGIDISLRPRTNGTTALMAAVYSGNEALVRFLLDRGEKADERDSNGSNALFELRWCRRENNNLAELLVKHGADVNAKSGNGSTPLAEVVTDGRTKSVRDLLDLGADLDVMALHKPLLDAAKEVRNSKDIYPMLAAEPARRESLHLAAIQKAKDEICALGDAMHDGLSKKLKTMRLKLKGSFLAF